MRLGVQLKPEPQPLRYGVLIGARDIQPFALLYRTGQLFFDLCLCLSQYVLADPLAGLGIVPGCVASLPSSVCAFADAALTIKEPHSGTQVLKRGLRVVFILLSVLFLSFGAGQTSQYGSFDQHKTVPTPPEWDESCSADYRCVSDRRW